MTGQPLPAVGTLLPQLTADPQPALDAVDLAHRLGLAGAFLLDHLWPLGGPRTAPILECWTLMGALAARCAQLPRGRGPSERLRLGTLVTRAGLRSPALLAHTAATVGQTARTPLVVGLGGGDALTRVEHRAFGLPWYAGTRRVDAVQQAVDALRSLPPTRGPRPAVWIGGAGGRLRALAGQTADAWNLWAATPAELAAGGAEVRRAAAAAGRDPATVQLTWGGPVLVGATAADAARRLGRWAAGRDPEEVARALSGDADTVVDRLAQLRAAGAAWCVVAPVGGDRTASLERLAQAAGLPTRPTADP